MCRQPLSRDVERADALRRTLTVYRMAFGQNRQDDLVAYLVSRFPPEEIERLRDRLKIDLAPKRNAHAISVPVPVRPRDAGPHDDFDIGTPVSNNPRLTLERATSLLDAFAATRGVAERRGVEQYRELLDKFVKLRG
jgi:hypothetical protein